MGLYLAFKEVWRNRGRFFLFSLVIALITTLVLFVAALAQGLALANKQYIEKIDAQLIVFQNNVKLSAPTSQIVRSSFNDIQRVEGVDAIGPIGLSSATLMSSTGKEIDVALIGVEAGKPGEPEVRKGRNLRSNSGFDVLIDSQVAEENGIQIGDSVVIKSIQAAKEEFYTLKVAGITDPQQYQFRPSFFVPYRTWDEVKPQGPAEGLQRGELITNIVAVRISDRNNIETVKQSIENQVADVEVADIKTAYEAIPGYSVQQSTLNTQQFFVLLIGTLVIGGFFQIQMLQKIPQIGVMKAIGTSNLVVATAAVAQIILVTTFGVALGAAVTLLLAIGIPATVPIAFNGPTMLLAVIALLAIGPLGGLVTIRVAINVEPLTALGLSS